MGSLNKMLAGMNEEALQVFIEQRAIEYEKVITFVFNKQTGVVAIVQLGDDVSTRKPIYLNSGFRPERDMLGRLVVLGPFEQKRGKETIHYYRNLRGARVEFKDGLITRFVTSKGKVIDLGAGVKNFKGFSVAVNEQHAEMRLLRWAKIAGWKIVGLAPTRGCCKHCHAKLVEVFKDKFESMVPKSRQTQGDYKAAGPEKKGRVRRIIKAAKGKLPKLPKGADKALKGISKTLKVLGPVMLALNAATTAAKAADELQHGRQEEAAKTMAEFAGGIGGAWLFGAGLGLVLGPPGALIGAAVGASLGERGARMLCDDIFRWVNSNVALDHAKHASAARKPDPTRAKQPPHHPAPLTIRADLVEDVPCHYDDPAVAQLQAAMYENGYSHPQVNLVCKLLTDLNAHGPSKATDAASLLVKLTSPQLDQLMALAKLPAHYPWSDNTQSGYVSVWMEQKLLQGRVRPSHKGTKPQGGRATAGALDGAPAGDAGHHAPQTDPQGAANLAVGAMVVAELRGQPATPDPAGHGSQGTGTAPPDPAQPAAHPGATTNLAGSIISHPATPADSNAAQGGQAAEPSTPAQAQGGTQTSTDTSATSNVGSHPAPSADSNAAQGGQAAEPPAPAQAQGGTQTTTDTSATSNVSSHPAPPPDSNAAQGGQAAEPSTPAQAQGGTQTSTDTSATSNVSSHPAPSADSNAAQGGQAAEPSTPAQAQGGTQTSTDTSATGNISVQPAPSADSNAPQGGQAAEPSTPAQAQGGTQTSTDTSATSNVSSHPAPPADSNAAQGGQAAEPSTPAQAQGGTQTTTDTSATSNVSSHPAPSADSNAAQGGQAAEPSTPAQAQGGTQTTTDTSNINAHPAPSADSNAAQGDNASTPPTPAQGQAPAQNISDTNVPANDTSQSPSHADGSGGHSASPTAPSAPEQGNAPAPHGADPNAAPQPAAHADHQGAANDPGQAAASGASQSAPGAGVDNAGHDAPAPTPAPGGQNGNGAQPANPEPSDATAGQGAGPGSGAAGTGTAGQTPAPMHVETSVSGVWLNAPHVTSIPELQAEMAPPLAGPFGGNNDPAGSQANGTVQTSLHHDSDGQDEGAGQAFMPDVESGQHAAVEISIDQGHGFDASHSGGFDAPGHGGDGGDHGGPDYGGDGGDGAGHGDHGHAADQGGHSAPDAYGHHGGYGGDHGAHGDHGDHGGYGGHGGDHGGGGDGGGGDGGGGGGGEGGA